MDGGKLARRLDGVCSDDEEEGENGERRPPSYDDGATSSSSKSSTSVDQPRSHSGRATSGYVLYLSGRFAFEADVDTREWVEDERRGEARFFEWWRGGRTGKSR